MSVCRCTCNFSFCIQGEVDRRKGQIKLPTDVLFIRGFSFLTIFYFKPRVIHSSYHFRGGGELLVYFFFLMFCCFVYVTFSLSIFICHHRSSILFMFFVYLFSISFCLWGFLCLIIFVVVVVVFAYVIFFRRFPVLCFSFPSLEYIC